MILMCHRQGLSTYRELCSIANDLNQPDLIYKFMSLASHNAQWNSKKVYVVFMLYILYVHLGKYAFIIELEAHLFVH
jgi:hypothetical protein